MTPMDTISSIACCILRPLGIEDIAKLASVKSHGVLRLIEGIKCGSKRIGQSLHISIWVEVFPRFHTNTTFAGFGNKQ